jgi:hypothetical protein
VVLEKPNGKLVEVPYEMLSRDDREMLLEIKKAYPYHVRNRNEL